MSKKNDHLTAFPECQPRDDRPGWVRGGMKLRDYFAGQALAGMLAYYNGHRGDYHTNASPEEAAKDAYVWADALLKAREESPNDED